jgi:hypothetical protein
MNIKEGKKIPTKGVKAMQARLFIMGLTNPASPTLEVSFTTQASVYHMIQDGNTLYVPRFKKDLNKNNLSADPARPALTFTYPTGGYAMSVDYAGDYLYLANGGGGMLVFRRTKLNYTNLYLPLVMRQP